MSNELKPCPNCGKLDAKCEPSHYINHSAFSVFCKCGTSSRYAESAEKAIEIWNSRPIEDKLQSEIDKLNKALDLACDFVKDATGACPLDTYDVCAFDEDKCYDIGVDNTWQCYKEYYIKKAGE